MKNLILAFLFLPVFSFAQYGLKDCHVDLVFGYDYGGYNFQNSSPNVTGIQSFRIGTNINYPVSDRAFLVTGFRVASKTSTFIHIPEEEAYDNPIRVDLSTKWNNFYAEVPFTFRYTLKNIDWENRLYVEGGLQFNLYVLSMQKILKSIGSDGKVYDKSMDRYDEINDFTLGTNTSIGWEREIREHLKFFVQAVGRYQLFSDRRNPTNQSYHFGIETGLRF